jgi:hypothetical protein
MFKTIKPKTKGKAKDMQLARTNEGRELVPLMVGD